MKKRIQPPRKVKSVSNFRELQDNLPSEYSERDTVMSEEDKNPGLSQISDTMLMIQYLREQDEKRRKQEETQRVEEQELRKQEQEQQEERWTKLFELSKHGAGSIVDIDPMISRLLTEPTQQILLFRQMKHEEDIELHLRVT